MTRSTIVSSFAVAAALAAFVGMPSTALACQCSAQIAQAVTSINGNTNAVVTAMQAAISQAIAQSTIQLTGVARQQTVAHEKMKENEQELAKIRAANENGARIRDEQKVTPAQADQYCSTLLNGRQAGNGVSVAAALASDMARRSEDRNNYRAGRTTNASSLNVVYREYCDDESAKAGVCTAVPVVQQNADISARNLLYGPSITSRQDRSAAVGIDELPHNSASLAAANRFCETVAKPAIDATVPPPPTNADSATITAYLRQRNEAQRANLVQQYCHSITAARTPSLVATEEQKRILAEQYRDIPAAERPPLDQISYNQLIGLEIDKRFGRGSVKWGEYLATNKSPADQAYETNLQLAVHGRILLDIHRTLERGFAMGMAQPATAIVNSSAAGRP